MDLVTNCLSVADLILVQNQTPNKCKHFPMFKLAPVRLEFPFREK